MSRWRLLKSFLIAVGVAALLLTFFFPTTRGNSSLCFGGREFIVFAPLWRMEGRPADILGLFIEAGVAISIGVIVWVLLTDADAQVSRCAAAPGDPAQTSAATPS